VPLPVACQTPNLEENQGFRALELSPQEPPASEATLANPAAEGGTMGEKWPRNFAESSDFHVTLVLLHAVKHNKGQTAFRPLRRKAC
jgi:hypothetical protein